MSNIITVVTYDDAGRITQSMRAPAGVLSGQLLEVEEWRPDYDATHYVVKRRLTERPANPAQLIDKHLIHLPVPCVVTINGRRYDCRDGYAELDFTYPGTYSVSVEAFPYRDAVFTVATK